MQRTTCRVLGFIFIVVALSQSAWSQASQKWVVSWAASAQGPYPVGIVSAQPDQRFAFPDPAAGARDQTLRLIVRPSIWGQQMRIRFSNVFGTRPVTFDGVHVGLQLGGPGLAKGTNRPITFGGKDSVTVPPGRSVWSDGVVLDFVHKLPDRFADEPEVQENRAFAAAQAGNDIQAIAELQTLIDMMGPTPERFGLLGGRYKRLADLATAKLRFILPAVFVKTPTTHSEQRPILKHLPRSPPKLKARIF